MTNRTRMAAAAAAALSVYVPLRAAAETDFTFYGHLNLSVDFGSQGLAGLVCNNPNLCTPGSGAQGNLRWIPDVSSNLSRFGIRGHHDLLEGVRAVFQLEAEVAVAATPGVKGNGNNDTINPGNNAINGAIASRNSFVGIATPLGALKIGKSDAPYKLSTADFDFLADTPGDYNGIVGNTGGDNRAEFDTRLSHSVWYESPDVYGFRLGAQWSPGQERFEDNEGFPIGETVCNGGNSGPCEDGSWGTAYSFAATWEKFGFKGVAAYELHKRVNRTGDAGATTPAGVSTVGVADEWAWKFGAKYTLAATGTTVAGLFEDLHRDDVGTFNERQRSGFYFSALQKVTPNDDVMAAWAHANSTPGDPTIGPISNSADMLTGGYRHWFDKKTTVYLAYARMMNGDGAHYALGPSGHGVTWDCKDGSGPATAGVAPGIGLIGNGTQCFTGTNIQAFSAGMTYDF